MVNFLSSIFLHFKKYSKQKPFICQVNISSSLHMLNSSYKFILWGKGKMVLSASLYIYHIEQFCFHTSIHVHRKHLSNEQHKAISVVVINIHNYKYMPVPYLSSYPRLSGYKCLLCSLFAICSWEADLFRFNS